MKRSKPPVRSILASVALLVPLGMALAAGSRPAGTTTVPEGCDPERMMEMVRHFCTHPDGSLKSRLAYRTVMDTTSLELRDSLAAALGSRGTISLHTFMPKHPPGYFTWAAAWDTLLHPYRHRFASVVGFLPGSAGDGSKFLVVSHYDAIARQTSGWRPWAEPAPGADDNMSGTAAVLELARRLAADPPYPFDIEFICFDGEEMGLWGSDTLARAESAAHAKILGVFNIDMFGWNPRRDSVVVMTNTSSSFLADLLVEAEGAAPQPDFTLSADYRRLYDSDHAPFWSQRYPAVMLIENVVIENPTYHRTDDTPENLSRDGRMMAKGANTILRALRRLGAAASGPAEFRPVAFARIGGYEATRAAVPGDTIDLAVIAFNAGGSLAAGESLPVRFYRVDDAGRHPLGERTIDGPLITGGRAVLASDPIRIIAADGGAVRIDAELGAGSGLKTLTVSVPVKTSLTRVVRHYVAPNPVRDPDQAWICYELSREASMRLTLFDLHGREIGKGEFAYSGGEAGPGSNVGVGLNRVPLTRLLSDPDLAPGVYLYRIELFPREGAGESLLDKFAVVR